MKKIMLVGLPNAGKTTLYNALTGENEKVGNWHGVTVEEKSGEYVFNGEKVTVFDLPGLYTLKGSSAEERRAEKILNGKNYDGIIVVVDANRFNKSRILIEELKGLNKPIVVFINLYADFLKNGGKIEGQKASLSLGVEILFEESHYEKTVEKIKEKIYVGLNLPKNGIDKKDFYLPQKRNVKLKRFLFGKYTAFFVFIFITAFILWFSFGKTSPVNLLSASFEYLINLKLLPEVKSLLGKICSPFLVGLVCDGILKGVTAVLIFLPQVCALSFCIDFLDQSGYLSGFSAVADDTLGKFGLSGRALYTLFGGFGCTAIAVNSANGIEDKGVRLRTVLSLPFISCSAKTPVYLFFASCVFKSNSFVVIFFVWILSVIFSFLNSLLLKGIVVKAKTENFISEVAELKRPKGKTLLKSLQKTAIQFIIKLMGVVLIVSGFLWILQNVSTDFTFLNGENIEKSLLSAIGKPISVIFRPIGITDWRYSVAITSGVFAKEGIVSTLSLLFPSGISLSYLQTVSLTVFCYAYTPCVLALSSISKNTNSKIAIFCAVYQLICALLLCYAVYFIGVL